MILTLSLSQENINIKNWVKKNEDMMEYLDVFLYNCLDEGIIWNSYYKNRKEHFFKCGDSTCAARLKVIVNEEPEEKKDLEEQKKDPKILSTATLKEKTDLKIPILEIYTNEEHKTHNQNYTKLVEKRLKGNLVIILINFIETGIHHLLRSLLK